MLRVLHVSIICGTVSHVEQSQIKLSLDRVKCSWESCDICLASIHSVMCCDRQGQTVSLFEFKKYLFVYRNA